MLLEELSIGFCSVCAIDLLSCVTRLLAFEIGFCFVGAIELIALLETELVFCLGVVDIIFDIVLLILTFSDFNLLNLS